MALTRFVKSNAEVAAYQKLFAAPAFLQMRTLTVAFETDPAIVAELLPPPLEPAEQARIVVSIYTVGDSNCAGPFAGAAVNVTCRYGGESGVYCLAMPMTTDAALIFGRELYAEPKKLAEVTLDGDAPGALHGVVRRHGAAFIELHAAFEDQVEEVERESESNNYYFKAFPSADGAGFAHDPELVRVTHRTTTRRISRGSGTITFRESRHDPVIDIPVLSVISATLSEGEMHTSAEVVATVAGDSYAPYAFAKMDDLTA